MKKVLRIFIIVGFLVSSLAINVPVGRSQSLDQERVKVIEMFMMGITESFSYEEVEAYIQEEEAYILETGNTRPFSSYGINGNHSTGQSLMLLEYLDKYLAANTSESPQEDLFTDQEEPPLQLSDIYPYAVDFTQLAGNLSFYEAGGDNSVKFTVENDGGSLRIHSAESYTTLNGHQNQFSGIAENNQTQAFDVRTRNGATRTVNVNTELSVWTTAHRRDLTFYFFHNQAGGLSLLVWELENPSVTLMEYTTIAGTSSPEPSVDTVDSLTHAPYLNDAYYYRGGGSDLEGGDNYRKVTLQFPPDEKGLYQFVVEELIFGEFAEVTYVYQITDQGVYEQAYFETANEEKADYRYHEDSMNELSSLILPAEVYPGLTFNSGYRDQTQYKIIALYDSYDFEGKTYKNVIEMGYKSEEDPNTNIHEFLAADIGFIGSAYYIESMDNYNLIYYLDTNNSAGWSTLNLSSPSDEGDYPFAVASEDLGETISFYGTGTTNMNLVVYHPETNLLDVYQDDLKDGGYTLVYSTPVQLTQVATQQIDLNRNSQLVNQYDLPNTVEVNTQLIALNSSVHKDTEKPFYLFYNAAGDISLAYWNDTSAYNPSNGGNYFEMIPSN